MHVDRGNLIGSEVEPIERPDVVLELRDDGADQHGGDPVARSALAFTVIKWFGVAYLVYLGVRRWLRLRRRPRQPGPH